MIYLDNCSTTQMRDEVILKMTESLREDFANPSSLHRAGFTVEKKIEEARSIIARYLRVDKDEIYFTSGGTESNNLAISSTVNKLKSRGKHLVTTSIEHASVLNQYRNLEKQGYDVTYLGVDENGNIDLEELKNTMREDTILVSLMHVNNEIGSIIEVENVKKIMRDKNSFSVLHVDGVQAFGKIEFSLRDLGIDLYSFSSHKVYGPKGVGGLYISNKNNLDPVIFGGNQERGFRSGTENVSGIIAFGEAVRILDERFQEEYDYMVRIKKYFIDKIKKEIDDIKINGIYEETSPYIVNLSIRNTRGEVLLHYLEQEKIYISTSSACSSNDTKKSHVLKSIGLDANEIEGSIRICFSYRITKDDIDYTVDKMKVAVEEIREIMVG